MLGWPGYDATQYGGAERFAPRGEDIGKTSTNDVFGLLVGPCVGLPVRVSCTDRTTHGTGTGGFGNGRCASCQCSGLTRGARRR